MERLSALPQFVTNIDGLDIHFIHVRSKHPNALPLIVTHGWDPVRIARAAWERPQAFTTEMRAAFKSVR